MARLRVEGERREWADPATGWAPVLTYKEDSGKEDSGTDRVPGSWATAGRR
ncbi:hypothetical protein AB0F03_28850 [Streptomyces sp. NPDC028722]|uniref:hypothetical protein n=1 Tax=Streptomyces sp. NPDC028722 TaxID=3155016 RepID=UPI0033E33D6F